MVKRKINNNFKHKSNTSEEKRYSITAIVGSVIILFGIALISYNYVQSKKVMAYDYMANVFYTDSQENKEEVTNQDNNGTNTGENIENTQENNNQQNNEQNNNQQNTQPTSNNSFQYIGFLEIPKINLKKGFVDKNSKDNDVEKNLYIAPNSSYPDVDKGNLIIAAHSGTGWKAFFNNLYKLSNGDQAIITYNNKKYTYSIVNVYKQNKTGKIAIYRNYEKTTLTLVTCTNDDDKTQTVYIAELVSIS